MDYRIACSLLEIPESSGTDPELVKKNYHRLAKQFHPDKNKHGEEKFKEISEAYNFLSNPPQNSESITDIFNIFSNSFSSVPIFGGNVGLDSSLNLFNNIFGNFRGVPGKPIHIEVEVSLKLKEFFNGTSVIINFVRKCICDSCLQQLHTCPHCNGMGKRMTQTMQNGLMVIQTDVCQMCMGERSISTCAFCDKGYVEKDISKDIYIHGNAYKSYLAKPLIIMKEGHECIDSNSHLHINIKIVDSDYEIKNNDVYITKTISLKESLLGIGISINSFDEERITINDNNYIIKEGDGYKFKGRGLYDDTQKRGNLFVAFKVKCPKKLSTKHWNLISENF